MIFVDTGGWYALMDATDPNHPAALAVHRNLAQPTIAQGRLLSAEMHKYVEPHLSG